MRQTGDTNARVVVAALSRAALVGVIASSSGSLAKLSVFGGALGVGIGLGLQKLASNYIAGFTILLDRSVRIGDMITVDNRFGVVSKATARYVVVRSLDGIEAIVPNETMVTTTVLNHSYTSRDIKVGVPIQVSYDSDLDRAMRLMTDVALGDPGAPARPAAGPGYPVRRKAVSTSSSPSGSTTRKTARATSSPPSIWTSGAPSGRTTSRFRIRSGR